MATTKRTRQSGTARLPPRRSCGGGGATPRTTMTARRSRATSRGGGPTATPRPAPPRTRRRTRRRSKRAGRSCASGAALPPPAPSFCAPGPVRYAHSLTRRVRRHCQPRTAGLCTQADTECARRLRRKAAEAEAELPAEADEEDKEAAEEESEYETDSEEEGFGRALLKPVFVPKACAPSVPLAAATRAWNGPVAGLFAAVKARWGHAEPLCARCLM